ncbi:MAG: hypothetical protein HDR13_10945 [Lachnospiraceae bacterium]|nr:hypothetical protein [Lachnospiraceae bacterium]
MTEKLKILQKMENAASNIKAMEEKLETIRNLDANLADSVQVHYTIPINYKYPYGKAKTISKEEKVRFSIPEGLEETVIDSVRQLYEQCLKRYYQLLDEYTIQLKNAP